MKTVVMEVNGKHAVVLNGDGGFLKIKNMGYRVGQRLDKIPRAISPALSRWVAAAAVVVLLVAGSTAAYCTPYTQVSLDVNPSIELNLNLFDLVISATPMNADGEKILEQANVLNGNLPSALQNIVAALASQGYIKPGEEVDILLTAASPDQERSQGLLKDAVQTAEQQTTRLRINANVIGECVDSELQERAREYGVSPGKLMLAEQYALSTGKPRDVDISNWLDKPVKEMLRNIAANGSTTSPNGNGYYSTIGNKAGTSPSASNTTPAASATALANQNGTAGDGNKNRNGWTATPAASPAPSASPAPCATEPIRDRDRDQDKDQARDRDNTGTSPSPCQTNCPTTCPTDCNGPGPVPTDKANGYQGGR